MSLAPSLLSVYGLPVAMAFAVYLQPNENRKRLSVMLVILHCLYAASCLITPDSIYLLAYLCGSACSFAAMHWLSASDSDSAWCLDICQLMLVSILFNGAGGIIWLSYSAPTVYNACMFLVNIMVIRSMMVNCEPFERGDNSSVVGGRYGISFMPRLLFDQAETHNK